MENQDIKTVLSYLQLLNKQVLTTSDNDLLIELLDHIDDVCKNQISVIEDLEEE